MFRATGRAEYTALPPFFWLTGFVSICRGPALRIAAVYNSRIPENSGRASMNTQRRQAMKAASAWTLVTLATAAGWLKPGDAAAEDWNKGAFDTHSMDETLKALGGSPPAPSKDIVFFSTP